MDNLVEMAIIQRLEDDLPLVPNPYKMIADDLGIKEKELLDYIKELQREKVLRKVGAVLHHRTAGIKANAMVVWRVPKMKVNETVAMMVSYYQVSHCYERETTSDWPYNIYTMIHAKTIRDCDSIIFDIAKSVEVEEYEVLYSVKELKKTSMKYFYENKFQSTN